VSATSHITLDLRIVFWIGHLDATLAEFTISARVVGFCFDKKWMRFRLPQVFRCLPHGIQVSRQVPLKLGHLELLPFIVVLEDLQPSATKQKEQRGFLTVPPPKEAQQAWGELWDQALPPL